MTRPVRLQLSRRRGFNLLSLATNGLEAVNVARPGKYANPHRIGLCGVCGVEHSREDAIAEFEAEVSPPEVRARIAAALRGKNLACWCRLCERHKPGGLPLGETCDKCAPCHADVLLAIANKAET